MVAIKTGGISSIRIFVSLMIFGLFVSLIGYVFQEIIVVVSENKAYEIEKLLYEIPGDLPIEPDVFVKSGEYSIYVNNIERNNGEIIYNNIQLYKIQGKFPIIITAEKAIEKNGLWILKNGFNSSFNTDGSPRIVTKFKTLKIRINADEFLNYIKPTGQEKTLSARELLKMINIRKKASLNSDDLEIEFHFKLAFPLSTFIILFSLVPLCLLVPMKSNALGMVLGIIIFFIYWNIMWFSKILGETGGISPLLSGWSIVIIFGIAGLILSFILLKK